MDAPIRLSSDVNVFFRWSGPTEYFDGVLNVGNIEIKGLPNEVAIYDLPNLKHDETKPLKFQVKDKNSILSFKKDCLKISIDQLNRIRIVAGVLEPTQYIGPKIMDSRTGRMISPNTSTRRTVSTLNFKKPDNIEVGASYHIICTHEGARLEKCEPARPKDAFEVLFDSLMKVQNNVNISIYGWGVRIVEQINEIINQLYAKNTREQIEQMLESSKTFTVPIGEEQTYLQAVKMLNALIQVYKDQEEVFRNILDLISRCQYGDAWGAISQLEKQEKKAEAFNILIKEYYDRSNNFSWDAINRMVKAMPEGDQKEDVLNYIDAKTVRSRKVNDPAEAFLMTSKLPNGELKNQLIDEVKAAQADLPEVDVDTTLLFGKEEISSVQPVVKSQEACVIS